METNDYACVCALPKYLMNHWTEPLAENKLLDNWLFFYCKSNWFKTAAIASTKKGHNSVNFTANGLKFGVAGAESHQHKLHMLNI